MTTILIAEDYDALRYLFARVLTTEGFAVETVSNGLALVQRALALTPDVILTDVWMPTLSGIEAITYLRADTRTAHIPIIALSAEPTCEAPAVMPLLMPERPDRSLPSRPPPAARSSCFKCFSVCPSALLIFEVGPDIRS